MGDGVENFEEKLESAKNSPRRTKKTSLRNLFDAGNKQQRHRILRYVTNLNQNDAYYYIDKLNWDRVPDPVKRGHLLNLVGDTNSETREYAVAQLLQSRPSIEGFPAEEPSEDLRDVFLKYGFPEYTKTMLETDVPFRVYELYKAAEGGLYDAKVLQVVLESDRVNPSSDQCARTLSRYIKACFKSSPKQRNTFDKVDDSDAVVATLQEHGLPYEASIDYSDKLFDLLIEEQHEIHSLPVLLVMARATEGAFEYEATIEELFRPERIQQIPVGDLDAFFTYFSKTAEPSGVAREAIDALINNRALPHSEVLGKALQRDDRGSQYLKEQLPERVLKSVDTLSKKQLQAKLS